MLRMFGEQLSFFSEQLAFRFDGSLTFEVVQSFNTIASRRQAFFRPKNTNMDITQPDTPTRMITTRHGPLIHNTELQTHNTERAFPTRITTCFQEHGVPHNDLGKQRFFHERAREK